MNHVLAVRLSSCGCIRKLEKLGICTFEFGAAAIISLPTSKNDSATALRIIRYRYFRGTLGTKSSRLHAKVG